MAHRRQAEVDREVATEPRRRTQLFASLCAMVVLINLARIVFAPLIEPFRATFALSAGEAGLIATLAWLGSALPRLPTGYLLTRIDRHRIVLGTGGLLTVASAFTAVADGIGWLYVGAFLMGISSGAYFIAANPLVSELFPDRVGRAMGIHGTASQVAAVGAAPFVGAVLGVGVVLPVANWRLVFAIMSGATLLSTLVLYWIARRATLPDAGRDDRNLLVAVRAQWPIVLTGIAVLSTAGFVWNGTFNLYVTYLVETKGLTQPAARDLLTLVFAAGVPAFWLSGRLVDRLPSVPYLLAVYAAFVVTLVGLTLAEGLVAIAAASVAIGYAVHGLFPAIDTYLLGTLPDEHRGSAYAVYSATMMLIQSTGSVVVGTLVDADFAFDLIFRALAGGLTAVFLLLAGLYLAGRLPAGRTTPR